MAKAATPAATPKMAAALVRSRRTAALPVCRVTPELVELEEACVVVLPEDALELPVGWTTKVIVELGTLGSAAFVVIKVVAVTAAVTAPAAGWPLSAEAVLVLVPDAALVLVPDAALVVVVLV